MLISRGYHVVLHSTKYLIQLKFHNPEIYITTQNLNGTIVASTLEVRTVAMLVL